MAPRYPVRAIATDDEQERSTTLLVPDRTGGRMEEAAEHDRSNGCGGLCGRGVATHRELAAHRVCRGGRADDGAWDAAQLEGTK
jgi:hypothetical protein